jgi:ABC-type bacteriocin/lantibiotic exporter with double-glycine peptidase domain
MKAGAGGYWNKFNELIDLSIPKQRGLSCVAAVGEMLLKERGIFVPYQEILDIFDVKASFYDLARALNKFDNADEAKWIGAFLPPERLGFVLSQENFGVILQEPRELGHAVFIKSVDKNGTVLVFDSADQTSYYMTKMDFNNNWGGGVIYREENK